MDDKFLCGVVLGMLGGAVIATNSSRTRQIVRDGQEQVSKTVKSIGKSNNNEKNNG